MVSRVSLTSSGSLRSLRCDLEPHGGVDRPAHLLDGLVEGQTLDLLVVDMRDDVVGEDAGPRGRGLVDRRDDLDEPFLHGDLDAETAELAAGLHLHVAEAFRVHVARMRIEAGEHAVDGRFDELGLVRLLDVIRADLLEHVAEQAQLPVGLRGGRDGAGAGQQIRLRHEGRSAGADDGAHDDK